MTSDKALLDVSLTLNSLKKKEKLNSLENLTDLLNQETVVKSLHKKSNSISWEIIFIRAHNAVLSLIDENSSKVRQMSDKHLQIMQNVIIQIAQKSLNHKILSIDCNLIVSCVLTIFETEIRIKFLGPAYLNLLNKFVLSEKKNWCLLKEDNWTGIKNLCMQHFKNPPQGIHSTLFLEILIDVIRFSSKNCLTTHNFLDLFDFLRNIFILNKKSGSGFEIVLLQLTNTLCLQLAIEFRYRVCEFMESVFDSVITLHEKKKPEKNILIYHFFITTLNVHNPDGTWEETAYAFNYKKWKSQVRDMFFLCQEEVKVILRNGNEVEYNVEFLELFVNVAHLISVSNDESFSEICTLEASFDEPGSSNKRKYLDFSSQNTSFYAEKVKRLKLDGGLKNLIKDLQLPERWFWLKFLDLLIQKYPLDLKNGYCRYVETLFQLVCDKRDVKNNKFLLRCLCGLLEIHNFFEPELTTSEVQHLNEIWNKLSMEMIRSLNEGYPETHLFIRSLISHSKLRDPIALVRLYCNELPSSLDNFKTLCSLCQNCIIPEAVVCNNETFRSRLLSWLLEEKYPCRDLSKALIALILKRFEEDIEVFKEDILVSRNNINDFCKIITNNYMTVAFKNLKFVEETKVNEESMESRFDERMKNSLMEVLAARGKIFLESLKTEQDYSQMLELSKNCLWFCELLCHLISHFENMSEDTTDLYVELQMLLHICSLRCVKLLQTQFFDLTAFSSLYDNCYHHTIQKKIRDFINTDFLKLTFEFFNNRCEDCVGEVVSSSSRFSLLIKNPKSLLHFDCLSQNEKFVVNCLEFMCQYIVVPGCEDSNRYQSALAEKIVKSLINDESLNVKINFHLQLVLRLLYSFAKYDAISDSVLNSCFDLLQLVFNSKIADSEVIIMMLQILKDFANLVHKFENSRLKYLNLVEGFRNVILRRNCGTKAVSKFIECLSEIAKVDSEGTWAVLEAKGCLFRVYQDIISFLKHSYHEIRLAAAQHLGSLFIHHKTKETIQWQKTMLDCVYEVFMETSKLWPKAVASVTEYSDYTSSSVSLISWASIICCSCFWRKKTLFLLLHSSFVRKVKKSDIKNIVNFICKELKITTAEKYISPYLPYLLQKWAENELQYQDFPFYLLEHHSVEDFLQNQYSLIITTYLQNNQLDIVKMISTKLSLPTRKVLQDCHSMLMSFILPSLSENVETATAKKAQKLKRFLDTELTSKISIQWLTESLDEVIYHMIKNLHDSEYLYELCDFKGNIEDNISSVSFDTVHIIDTLDNMSTNEGRPLLGKIALEVPAMIEKILIHLLGDMEAAVIYQDRIFTLYKYVFFIDILSKATVGYEYRAINAFIIRDVIYTLTGVIKKDEAEILTIIACECLRKIAERYVIDQAFGKFLPTIITVLTPLVKKSNSKALYILKFLVCDNYSKLKSDITSLDPFPSDEIFAEINSQVQKTQDDRTLKNAIQHFIKAGSSKNSGCRLEGLKNLKKMLECRKDELKDMYENLKILRGFSEDCKKSLLHQLIYMLVELTSDQNMAIKVEAANCLGELGPSDLTTLVLRPENNVFSTQEDTTAVKRLIKSSLSILIDLLISDDFEVKKATSKALYALLSVKQGKELINNFEERFNKEYLTPFLSSTCSSLQLKIKKETFLRTHSNISLWLLAIHEVWVVNLVDTFLESLSDTCGLIETFRKLIKVHWQFAEFIFPVLLDFILSLNEKDCNNVINKNLNFVFEQYFDLKNKSLCSLNKTSVKCLVNAVDYIRIQRNYEGIYQGFGLNLNYLHVAKAALYCSAFFTSIFYAEQWFEEKRKNDFGIDINKICESYQEEGFALTEILRECHSKIGNSDGIHGCGYMHILDPTSEIQHYQHLKNWNLSLLYHDIQMSQGSVSSEVGLFNSLEQSGMLYTLNSLIKGKDLPEMPALFYKCAAKLQDWTQVDSCVKTNDYFDKNYYFSLKAFHEEDHPAFQNEIQKARKAVLSELRHCSLESTKNLYLPLSELQRLKEIEEFAQVTFDINLERLKILFNKWEKQDSIKCSEFKLVESILINRGVIIKEALERTEEPNVKSYLRMMLCDVYCKLIIAARKEKKYETAIRTLSYLNNLPNIPEEMTGRLKLEKSRILWERGDREIGRFLLSHFLKRNEITGELKAKSLRIYGDWMANTKSENSREIIENYYLESIAKATENTNRIDSFASLAKFADSNYEQLNEYLSSPLFEIKQNLINTQQDLASELRQELGWNQNKEKRIAYQIAAKQSAIDENEIKNSRAEKDSYLNLALKYYLLSLKDGEKHNLAVFRVLSLWLSNPSNPDVIQQLQKILRLIPTYKFLCLLPQLVPRMADVCLISELIEQILQDHPHHTLPLVFALNNSYEDLKYSGVNATHNTPRVLAAKSMLEKFQTNQRLAKQIAEMRQFFNALIELANYNPADKGKPGIPVCFPEHLRIRHISNFTSVSVPSLNIPYRKTCIYDDVISVHKFEENYYLVGGVNLPKRIKCVGSDGISRPLLVKGKDDLRQDAVMQQVFTIMNSLLYQNSESNKRKLVIRTYKVVPLSQRSGVIEWCENTQPLSHYLTGTDGKSGAHKKFYPNDMVAFDCRCAIRKVFAQPEVTNEDKLKVFLEICKQIHPVFHHFFIEKFPAAGVWFERRLAYIHSVATSSMIGYILGIGDRHVYNILIDNATAEVIHIDLGIAFEQGKTLPTPETVPFRLTRDIVDGMGLSGIEGDFRISCIKTMEVLREYKDTILTLLEVLLYDPLYTWTITPEKAYSMQNQTEASSTTTDKSSPDLETNKMAERALIRLKQKLEGTETGCVATNVEGQVNYLIQQARDPNNLCRLFHGWQAYL